MKWRVLKNEPESYRLQKGVSFNRFKKNMILKQLRNWDNVAKNFLLKSKLE